MEFRGFDSTILQFLEELAEHNDRSWFEANKQRYARDVLAPSLALIRAFQPRLEKIAPLFVASDRRVGGSLMRVYRDTRFSRDKTPYKTNVGIQFRHRFGRDVHAPGFYIHIAPDECFLGEKWGFAFLPRQAAQNRSLSVAGLGFRCAMVSRTCLAYSSRFSALIRQTPISVHAPHKADGRGTPSRKTCLRTMTFTRIGPGVGML